MEETTVCEKKVYSDLKGFLVEKLAPADISKEEQEEYLKELKTSKTQIDQEDLKNLHALLKEGKFLECQDQALKQAYILQSLSFRAKEKPKIEELRYLLIQTLMILYVTYKKSMEEGDQEELKQILDLISKEHYRIQLNYTQNKSWSEIKQDLEKYVAQYKFGKISRKSSKVEEEPKKQEIILKSKEELLEEAKKVKELMMACPTMPERAGEVYHIVSMSWWQRWKKYTEYDKLKGTEEGAESTQVNDGSDAEMQDTQQDQEETEDSNVPSKNDTHEKPLSHPGPINSSEDLKNLDIQEQYLKSKDNDNFFPISVKAQEEVDFITLHDPIWQYLYPIYGGFDIPRYSIEIETEEDTPKEFIVEVFLKKCYVFILPKKSFHPSLVKPAAIFLPRQSQIIDLKKYMATVLYAYNQKYDLYDYLYMSRIWKLHIQESIEEIQKETNFYPTTFINIRGRVLLDSEILDKLNIAESDTLLYEVRPLRSHQEKNAGWTFIEKEVKTKAIRKNSVNEDTLTEEQLMSLPLKHFIEQSSRGGLVGLQNLGNTCFMNSVLQCLANTEPLAKFFLSDCYDAHINRKNPLGTKGKLAVAFSELLYQLYSGEDTYTAPWDVKNIIARRAVQFQGFAQHDSQEMLSFLLETLHEDLNDITKKPYVEHKDSDGRDDKEVSLEYWNGFLSRERSIFVDLFYGQLKSRVQCTVCNKISITFDPFNILSVPVPINKDQQLKIKYFPMSLAQRPKEFILNVSEYVTMNEIKQKILDKLSEEHKTPHIYICRVKNKNIYNILSKEKFIKSFLEKGDEIVAYQKLSHEDHKPFYFVEIKIFQQKKGYLNWFYNSSPQQICYSRIFEIEQNQTVRDFKMHIFAFFRPLIKNCKSDTTKLTKERLEEEYSYFFDDPSNQNPLYQIFINNNLPLDQGIIMSSRLQCDICGRYHKDNCLFDVRDDLKMHEFLKMWKYDRDFELVIQWNPNPQANLKILENPDYEIVNFSSQFPSSGSKGSLSLNDCIACFSQEETLTGNDKWYCSNCKNHQNALKKMEIYKSPEYLIIHLKRFSHQRNTFFGTRKITELVDFQIEGLDLSTYIISEENKENQIYDLYAVSNHYGSLNGGHYTAYCYNPVFQRWFEYDDCSVSKVDPQKAITKAAYVLFYKRRQTKK